MAHASDRGTLRFERTRRLRWQRTDRVEGAHWRNRSWSGTKPELQKRTLHLERGLEAIRRIFRQGAQYQLVETLPYDETTPLQGRHPYDVSKSAADLIAKTYAVSYDLPVAITRCGNFYGGGDLNWNRIIPGTIRSIVRGEAPVIRSDGKYIRDYFFVEDGAAAYMLLAERLSAHPELRGEAFNFSNEIQVTVLDIVQSVLNLMNSELQPIVLNQTSNEILHQYLSAEKARRLLDWHPLFTLESGLRKTIEWYREFFNHER